MNCRAPVDPNEAAKASTNKKLVSILEKLFPHVVESWGENKR